jgi:hypothetical protein
VSDRFVWNGMRSDVRKWCKECTSCQASKVGRHTHTPLTQRTPPDRRFGSLHVDLVGPLPPSEGSRYLFTVIDRFSRWPEAIPLENATAESCARALIRGWIARFGIPDDLVSDRGAQFTSKIWEELHRLLGIKAVNTCAYRPQANGMIERFHRQLKGALKARLASADWMDHLPVVLLGIRSAWREGLDAAPADLLYGTSLRLPGELAGAPSDFEPTSAFVRNLRITMESLKPFVPSLPDRTVFQPKDLRSTSHVYVRNDAVRKPLQRPYDGPFPVVSRHSKHFILSRSGKHDSVSIDRLKPAYLEGLQQAFEQTEDREIEYTVLDEAPVLPDAPVLAPAPVPLVLPPPAALPPEIVTTRTGRQSRPPNRLNL